MALGSGPCPLHRGPRHCPFRARADDRRHRWEGRRYGKRADAGRNPGGAIARTHGRPAYDQRRRRKLPLPAATSRHVRRFRQARRVQRRGAGRLTRRPRRDRPGAHDAQFSPVARGRRLGRGAAHRHGEHEDRDVADGRAQFPRLPLGRNYASVDVDGRRDEPGRPRVHGLRRDGLENQYLIDGVNTTGVRFGNQGKALNAEFIQEVEVRTGGYEAEFGQVFGGNINVITKIGRERVPRGRLRVLRQRGAGLVERARRRRGGGRNRTVPSLPRRLDAGVDLGGYFVKDRLWFFGAFDRVQTDQDYDRVESLTYPASGPPTSNYKSGTDRTRTNLFSGKLTFLAGPSQTIALSVFGDPGTYEGRRNGTYSPQVISATGPDSAILTNRGAGGTDVSAKWDGVFGTHFTVQLQYGYHEEKNRNTSDYPDTLSILQIPRRTLPVSYRGPRPCASTTRRTAATSSRAQGRPFSGTTRSRRVLFYEKLNSTRSTRFGGRGDAFYQFLDDTGRVRVRRSRVLRRHPAELHDAAGRLDREISGSSIRRRASPGEGAHLRTHEPADEQPRGLRAGLVAASGGTSRSTPDCGTRSSVSTTRPATRQSR